MTNSRTLTFLHTRTLLALAILAACQNGPEKVSGLAAELQSITVTPAVDTIVQGSATTLSAQPLDAGANPLNGVTVAWASSDTNVVSVSSTGALIAKDSTGTVQIAASAYGVNGLATVVVVAVPVATVIIAPSPVVARLSAVVQLSDTLEDSSGNILTGRAVTWSTDQPTIASVDQTGLVLARALGKAHIFATVAAMATQPRVVGEDTVTVTSVRVAHLTVSPPTAEVFNGNTLQLTAQPTDSLGNPLGGRIVTWQASNAHATVTTAGLVTAVTVGIDTIIATCEGITATSIITVPQITIAVTPSPDTINAGQGWPDTLTVTITDQAHNQDTLPTSWTSLNPGIVSVEAEGLKAVLVGVTPGTGTVTVTVDPGQPDAIVVPVQVTVVEGPLFAIVVTLPTTTVTVGSILDATAIPEDQYGNVLTGSYPLTWGSPGNGSVVTVGNSTGSSDLVSAIGYGTTTITATSQANSQIFGTSPTLTVAPSDTILGPASISASGTPAVSDTIDMHTVTGAADIAATVTWSDSRNYLTFSQNPSPNDGAGHSTVGVTVNFAGQLAVFSGSVSDIISATTSDGVTVAFPVTITP